MKELTIEEAFKVVISVTANPGLRLNRTEFQLVDKALIKIKDSLGIKDEDLQEEVTNEEDTNKPATSTNS